MAVRTWLFAGALALGACVTSEPELELGSMTSELDISAFVLPTRLRPEARAALLSAYDHIDPTDQVPRGLLEDALVFLELNWTLIPRPEHIVVVDPSLYSGLDRFWLIDLASGEVEPHKVAHGDGSDPDNDGYATEFGNVDGSHKTSLGFFLTGETYNGTHRYSMRLDGLSPDGSPNGMANTNARSRLIVMHEATYVEDARITQQGRSNGCFALDPDIHPGVVDRLKNGSLLYAATAPLSPPIGRGGVVEPDPVDPTDPTEPAIEPAGLAKLDADHLGIADDAAAGCTSGGGAGGGLALAFLAGVLGGRGRRRRGITGCAPRRSPHSA